MQINEDNYIILVKQFRASLSIIQDFKSYGIKIIYIGDEVDAGSLSDLWLRHKIELGAKFFSELIQNKNIIDVITLSEDAILFQNQLRKEIGLVHLSESVVKGFRDKSIMNQKLNALGLTVATQVKYVPELNVESLSYPIFIKPSTGYASAGAQRIDRPEDVKKAVRTIKRINQFALKSELPENIGIVIEEFIDGKEYSIDSLSINGNTKIFCICERDFPSEDTYQDYIYKSCSEETEKEIISALTPELNRLFKDINYTGAAHTEVRYCGNRKKWFIIESALRIGFSGVVGDYFKELTDIDYSKLFVQVILQKMTFNDLEKIDISRSKEGILMILPVYEGGEIEEIIGRDYLEKSKFIKRYFFNVNIGQRVLPYPMGVEYMGHVIAISENIDGVNDISMEIAKHVSFKYKRMEV